MTSPKSKKNTSDNESSDGEETDHYVFDKKHTRTLTLDDVGTFTYSDKDDKYFVETAVGNYEFSSSAHFNGTDTLRPFSGSFENWCSVNKFTVSRNKTSETLKKRCADMTIPDVPNSGKKSSKKEKESDDDESEKSGSDNDEPPSKKSSPKASPKNSKKKSDTDDDEDEKPSSDADDDEKPAEKEKESEDAKPAPKETPKKPASPVNSKPELKVATTKSPLKPEKSEKEAEDEEPASPKKKSDKSKASVLPQINSKSPKPSLRKPEENKPNKVSEQFDEVDGDAEEDEENYDESFPEMSAPKPAPAKTSVKTPVKTPEKTPAKTPAKESAKKTDKKSAQKDDSEKEDESHKTKQSAISYAKAVGTKQPVAPKEQPTPTNAKKVATAPPARSTGITVHRFANKPASKPAEKAGNSEIAGKLRKLVSADKAQYVPREFVVGKGVTKPAPAKSAPQKKTSKKLVDKEKFLEVASRAKEMIRDCDSREDVKEIQSQFWDFLVKILDQDVINSGVQKQILKALLK